jgi:hypothetical protein
MPRSLEQEGELAHRFGELLFGGYVSAETLWLGDRREKLALCAPSGTVLVFGGDDALLYQPLRSGDPWFSRPGPSNLLAVAASLLGWDVDGCLWAVADERTLIAIRPDGSDEIRMPAPMTDAKLSPDGRRLLIASEGLRVLDLVERHATELELEIYADDSVGVKANAPEPLP